MLNLETRTYNFVKCPSCDSKSEILKLEYKTINPEFLQDQEAERDPKKILKKTARLDTKAVKRYGPAIHVCNSCGQDLGRDIEKYKYQGTFRKGSLDDYYALGHNKIINHTEDFLRRCDLTLYNDFLEQEYWFEEVENYYPLNEDGEEDEKGEYPEIFQAFIVDYCFYKDLQEADEVVAESGPHYIWCRCSFGQAISMDRVIQDIAYKFADPEKLPDLWTLEKAERLEDLR